MRGTRISMIALAAAMPPVLGSAAHGESLVLKRDTGVKPVPAAAPSAGSTGVPACATKLGAPKSQAADPVILPFYSNQDSLPEGFPTESFCVKKASGGAPNQIRFIIRNTGGAPSGNCRRMPTFPTAGAAPAMLQVSLAPGAQKIVTQNLPANCYTPGFSGICQFSIELDTRNEVVEASEANNQDNSFCVSPAG